MNTPINRRDILKLAGLLPLGLASSRVRHARNGLPAADPLAQNVIVVVFDALTSSNIGLYGYSRQTMPNLARLAKGAVVYHNHYAASNFTTPGTASLLNGMLPWTHRAILPAGRVAEPFVNRNIFGVFDDYHRLAYTHNDWTGVLLEQAAGQIDELVPRWKLCLSSEPAMIRTMFRKDSDIASVGWARNMNALHDGYSYSLLLSRLYGLREASQEIEFEKLFPRGIPSVQNTGIRFLIETAVDWISQSLSQMAQPFLGYFHFLPPHAPYRTRIDFFNTFKDDGYREVQKPDDIFIQRVVNDKFEGGRRAYDEFILNVDSEFARLHEALQKSDLLENSWLILTSDHGELFERGMMGHRAPPLYQPVIRIPLVIFEPGRNTGMDVYTPTCAVDVLPTLAYVTGHSIPSWVEGGLLPPFAGEVMDPNRSLYAITAEDNAALAPLTIASTALIREPYKLMYCFGYEELGGDELVRLFDIQADPEELEDLSRIHRSTAAELVGEMKLKLAQADQPYL